MFTVLSVAYPLAPVRPDTAGGAEQVLGMLDAALTSGGYRSIVVAAEGSRPAGTLLALPKFSEELSEAALSEAHRHCRAAIATALERWKVDVIHLHGQDFCAYLPPAGPPVLVTLHVPRAWYGPEIFEIARPGVAMHCVSAAQRRTWPGNFPLLPDIENGVPVERFETRVRKRRYALALGRICPEKGFHLALDAAAKADILLLIAGEVYRYTAHQRYFREEIVPRLAVSHARFIGPVGGGRKRRLLAAAQCLLVPSQVAETSSLVSMEALAAGTPVVAYPAGALADIVEHGRTGFLVRSETDMAEAIESCRGLDPRVCRAVARERFSAGRMFQDYLRTYASLVKPG